MPPTDLSCLHGIRFLSTTWVILLHTHTQSLHQPSYNKYMMAEDDLQWDLQAINNALTSVDTFFVLSGLLVSYSLLRELDRNKGRFNVLLFYVHRYLRLTPVYAIILGFTATLIVYIGSGPHWQMVHNIKEGCRYNWWTNLLYVNNYASIWPSPKPCMGEAWYLACDMQMFWVSPLFIYPLWRWRKAGLAWVIFSIAAFIGATIAMYIVWTLPPTDMGTTRQSSPEKASFYYDYYFQTWARIPPYLVGILFGWILHKTMKSKVEVNPFVVLIGWVLATATGLAVVYGLTPYLDEKVVPVIDLGVSVAYGSLHRIAWAISVSWVIFACLHGYGGIVNRMLSWKGFVPLGRLTYVAYLFHWDFVTKLHVYQSRKPFYYTVMDQTMRYIGVLAYVFMASFIICLLVEIPLLNLEKRFVGSSAKKSEKKETRVPMENFGKPLATVS